MTSTEKNPQVRKLSGLAEVLRRTGTVTAEQLDEAHKLATYKSMQLGEALIALGHINREKLEWALALQTNLRSNSARSSRALAEVVDASMAAATLALSRLAG